MIPAARTLYAPGSRSSGQNPVPPLKFDQLLSTSQPALALLDWYNTSVCVCPSGLARHGNGMGLCKAQPSGFLVNQPQNRVHDNHDNLMMEQPGCSNYINLYVLYAPMLQQHMRGPSGVPENNHPPLLHTTKKDHAYTPHVSMTTNHLLHKQTLANPWLPARQLHDDHAHLVSSTQPGM